MLRNAKVSRKLFSSFLMIGLINLLIIIVLIGFIYSSRKPIITDRVQQHMTSVRNLTKDKLYLYFEGLKNRTINISHDLNLGKKTILNQPDLESLYVLKNGELKHIAGKDLRLTTENLPKLNEKFTIFLESLIFFRVNTNQESYLWFFNNHSINKLLLPQPGLGNTGETYLVGRDFKIRSASRHLPNEKIEEVKNDSVIDGLSHNSGNNIVRDYRNIEVLSSYTPFIFDSLEYVLLAEMDLDEVQSPLQSLVFQMTMASILMGITNLLFSLFLTRRTSNELENLNSEILKLNSLKERSSNESAIQVLKAQEEEREKISFTLHDSVGQYLTVLKWGLARLKKRTLDVEHEHIDNLSKTCDDVIHEIRSISHDLMPTLIKDFGCWYAIRDYFEKQKQIVPHEIEYEVAPDVEALKFTKEFDINLYRMVQEFFQNSLKHSQATAIKLVFLKRDDQLVLNYYDNGKGMDGNSPLPASLNYRAKLFGGEMTRVHYDKGLGFKVTFYLREILSETN
ncbi:sensor histidine kinase [Peredibacter sp. HCB2-198]|uniref:sensor histidine kinase n=1 Tax=Peredibacter sp. HCB2-198 TaxID=3383025 RepID=UPI0038B54EFB